MHAIARSVKFIFIGLIICMGSYDKNWKNSGYDYDAEFQRECEDYCIIKGIEEWELGNWM